jgi:RHS repeat-associated protein
LVTETRYDSAGRAVLQLGPVLNTAKPGPDLSTVEADLVYPQTRTTYDQAGRATAEIFQPRGTELWRTTTIYGGDRTTKIPPTGGTATATLTNAIGKTVALKQYKPGAGADSGTVTTYGYNRKGELQTVTGPEDSKWEYKRDVRGRMVQTKDPDKGTIDYTFDAVDRMATVTDARGAASALKYTYDGLSRKTGIYDRATNAKRATWAYDTAPGGKGQVASTSRWVGSAEYKTAVRGYNPRGLSTGTTTTLPDAEGALAGDYTFIIGYNITTDSSVAGYTYGGRADLMPETIFYNYDSATGLPHSVDSDYPGTNAYVKSTSYSGIAQPTGFVLTTDKRGAVETYRDYSYDLSTGRLDHSTTSTTSKGVVSDPHYTYDQAGNITRISNPLTGEPGSTDTQCFTQDYLLRLTEAWTPADGDCDPAKRSVAGLGGPAKYWQSWVTDDAGNRESQTDHGTSGGDAVTDFHTVAGKHALSSTTGALTGTYEYDPIGNLQRRPTGTGDQTLTWDAEGHLASIASGSATTSFIYDAAGTRLLRKEPATTTLYLGDVEIRLTKATGTIAETRGYKWADQTVALRTKTGVTWLANDHQGTANVLIDAATQRTTVRHQSPFGGIRGSAPQWPNQRGFLGGQEDPTGLTHLGAREYDPVTGRFISVDPVLDNSDPQQMNGYSYANNNPITACDPTGERTDYYDSYGGSTSTGSGSGGSGGGDGGGDSESSKDWWSVYKVPHEAAIAKRVEQIKMKWPQARRVTVTQADNFIKQGSGKGTGAPGYADIICWDCDAGRIYIWEMKHKGGNAEAEGPAQLTRYVKNLQGRLGKDSRYAADSGKEVQKGPRFGEAMNASIPNPLNPKQSILVEDGEADGIQVYSFEEKDEEPAPTPAPTATSTPTPMATDYPHPAGRTPSPSTTNRTPELPANDGVKVGAPDVETVITVVAVVAVVVVVVVAAIVLAPVAAAGVAIGAGIGSLFAW